MVKLSTAKVFVHTLSRCLQCLSTIGKNAFVDNFTTKALSIPALMCSDNMPTQHVNTFKSDVNNQGQHHGGGGQRGQKPPKDFKKKVGKLENVRYFHASKLLKFLLSSLTRKYMLWMGFNHNFSTSKVSASRGLCLLSPHQGAPPPAPLLGGCPWTPEVALPLLTIYPGAAPVN